MNEIRNQSVRHVKYNTGDKISYIIFVGKIIVTKIETHNGITWELGDMVLKHRANHPR